MRVAVIHNLTSGGAHRRLSEQLARLDAEVVEVCPATATPARPDAQVVQLQQVAPRTPRLFRGPLRYADLVALLIAWRRLARRIRPFDVVYANPCRYLQAPAALLSDLPPSLYFCDEPRRVDFEPAARASRNPMTRPVYGPMYAAERAVDRRAVARATRLATNSSFTAERIQAAYGRDAEVVPMGVPDSCLVIEPRAPAHVLSVGTMIPTKGHDIAIAAVGLMRRRWPLVVVAPGANARESARLLTIAHEHGVALDIRIGLSDRELAETYAAAQATVYMAVGEPLGLASLEAQASGSPVIVAAEGGLPETISEGRTGWAVPRDPAAVAERLDRLEERGRRRMLSAAAREHAAGLNWERSARAVRAILEDLCRS